MVAVVKPAHIRPHMVKCTTAGMVKPTALDMGSTTMNALVSTITLALVPEEEEAVQEQDALLVDQVVEELGITVDMMDFNGTVSMIEPTHGISKVAVVVVVVVDMDKEMVNTPLHTQLTALEVAEAAVEAEDMDTMKVEDMDSMAILFTENLVDTIKVEVVDIVDMADLPQAPLQLPLLLLSNLVTDMKEEKEVGVNNLEKNGNLGSDMLEVGVPLEELRKVGKLEMDTMVVEVPPEGLMNGKMDSDTLVVEVPLTQGHLLRQQ